MWEWEGLLFNNLPSSFAAFNFRPYQYVELARPCEPVREGHKTLQSFPPRTVSTSEGTKVEGDLPNIPAGLPGLAITGIFNDSPG